MKVTKAAGIAALMGMCAFNAQADAAAQLGPYAGVNVGYSTTEIAEGQIAGKLNDKGLTMTSISKDDNAFGFKLFGGYLFHKNFSVEGGYFNLGEFSYEATTSPDGTLKGSSRAQGVNVDAVGYLPVWKALSLTGRVGVHYSEVQEKYSGTGYVTVTDPDPKERDFGFKFGVGAQYDVTPRLSVRAEWEDYNFQEAVGNKADVNLFSVGLVYRFGGTDTATVAAVPAAAPAVSEKEVPEPELVVVEVVTSPSEKIVFPVDMLFDFDKADIKPAGASALNTLAAKLKPDDKLIITGHTDSLGSDMYNLRLSKRRADAVKTYLATRGVARTQMQTRAKGETEPIATNATEEGRAANRRVEIDINAEEENE